MTGDLVRRWRTRKEIPRHGGNDHDDGTWQPLYRAGGVSGLVFVSLVLIAVVLVVSQPLPPTEGEPLLAYIVDHRVVYLTQLICFVGLAVPALIVFAALTVALSSVNRSLAILGGLLGIVSETIALALGSSPQSLHGGLVVLSNSWANSTSETERASLASAADALIATTNAVTWAGILTAAAILVLSAIMRRSVFGRPLAALGVVTGALGIVSEAFRPLIGAAYMIYGLLLPTWFALVSVRLLRHRRRLP